MIRSRWFIMPVMVLMLAPSSFCHAGDDGQITVVVSREFYNLFARAVGQQVYINGKYHGTLENGMTARYSVPVSRDGKYLVRLRVWLSLSGGVEQTFNAGPGDEVLVKTSMDYGVLDSCTFKGVTVYPLKTTRLEVHPPRKGSVSLAVNHSRYTFDSQQTIETTEKTTENKLLRMNIHAQIGSSSQQFILLGRPGSLQVLDWTDPEPDAEARLLASLQYYLQLERCVAHHLGAEAESFGENLDELRKDFQELPTRGVLPEVIALRDRFDALLADLLEKSRKNDLTTVAAELAIALVISGAEVLLTQSSPTRLDMLANAAAGIAEIGVDQISNNSQGKRLKNSLIESRSAVVALLKNELEKYPHLKNHEIAKELIGNP